MIKFKPIKEIAKLLKTGKTPPSKERKYFDGELNWYTPGDLDKSKYLNCSARKLTTLAVKESKVVLFPKGTLLIGCIGDIGKIGITTIESSSNQQITGIYPKEDTDVSYLYYWFKANKQILVEHSNNAVVPILNNRTLEKIEIPLPPLETQKKIAVILDAGDAYHQKTKALIAKYDELAQSLFLEMFGDPVKNERNWQKTELKNYAKVRIGPFGSLLHKEDYVQHGVPLVNPSHIVKGKIVVDNELTISTAKMEELFAYKMQEGDIVLGRRGEIGRCAVVTINEDGYLCGTGSIYIRIKEKLNPIFLYSIISSSSIRKVLEKSAKGIIMKNLNSGNIENLQVLAPPIELQNQFAQHIQEIESQKALAKKSVEKSEYLFNSLLQKAFSGEILNN